MYGAFKWTKGIQRTSMLLLFEGVDIVILISIPR